MQCCFACSKSAAVPGNSNFITTSTSTSTTSATTTTTTTTTITTDRLGEAYEGVELEDGLLGVADNVAVAHVVDHLCGRTRVGVGYRC